MEYPYFFWNTVLSDLHHFGNNAYITFFDCFYPSYKIRINFFVLSLPCANKHIRMLLPQIEIFYPFYDIKHTLNSIKGYANSLANSSVDIFASLANKASLSEVSPKFSSFELFCICISRG